MSVRTRLAAFLLLAPLALAGGSCGSLVMNLTEEVSGNITFRFINDTPFRAVFSFGTYDALDNSPGPATLRQLRLEAHTTSAPTDVTCRRNAAIGTEDFLTRVRAVQGDQGPNFDPEAFDDVVRFSAAPQDDPAAGLPTAGFAEGTELLLGVDYSCMDLIIVTLSQSPETPGGFTITFSVAQDEEEGL